MTTPTIERPMPRLSRLWFGVGAAPVAWSVTELVGYAMVARSCERGWHGPVASGFDNPRPWMIGLTVLLAIVAASGLWTAVTNVRATTEAAETAASRAWFMAVAGVFVSSLFLAGIVLFGIPSLIVNACAQVR
jgi:hypothetical protein